MDPTTPRTHTRRDVLAVAAGSAAALALRPRMARAASTADVGVLIAGHVNAERASRGRPALAVDGDLCNVAHRWSAQMRDRGSLSHNSQRAAEYGWSVGPMSEVVAYVGGHADSERAARAIVDAWMGSRAHRDTLLGNGTHMGVGWAWGPNSRLFSTIDIIASDMSGTARAALELCAGVMGSGQARRVVLARDDDPADALAASALLEGDIPMLLVPAGRGLPAPIQQEISRVLTGGGTAHLVGGGLSSAVEGQLRDLGARPVRLQGASRYETAAIVADESIRLRGAPWRIFLASGSGWADAAAVGGFAAAHGTPILLTSRDALHPAAQRVLADHPDVERVVVGGEAVVSPAVAAAADAWRITGEDRAHTSARIMTDAWGTVARPDGPVVVTSGWACDGWAAALTHATIAARLGAPLVYAGSGVPPRVAEALRVVGFGSAAPAALRFARNVTPAARDAFTRATR